MTETIRNDLTVIGGGLAGVCAAITSARVGIKVALITNRPVLGGNSSSEMRMWTRGATGGGNLFAEEMGLLGELKLENLYRNPEGNVHVWDELLLDFVLQEANITLFLNTHVAEVVKADNSHIKKVKGYQLGSEKQFWFESPYFLDATGDGTVGYLAGADFRSGREGKNEFGELFAPDEADKYLLGSTIYFQTKETKAPVRFIAPSFAYSREEVKKLLNRGGRIVNEKMSGCDYWWLEYGGILDTIGDNQDITLELKRIALGIWDYIKNSGEFKANHLTLEWIGSLPGKRESRRFIGDYTLTQNDIMEHRRFEDAVCYGGWYLDFHPPDGVYSQENFCEQIPVTIYDIPMRCLYSKNIHNLLLAGRDISTTHAAFASTRIMNTCALTGQAAGMIAGAAIQSGKPLKKLYLEDREDIRQRLLANDMYLIGYKNTDSADKARLANVTVSSVHMTENIHETEEYSIKDDLFIIFPWQPGVAEIYLHLESEAETRLEIDFYQCERPEGYRRGLKVGEAQVIVSKTGNWRAVPLNFQETGSYYLAIKSNPKVALSVSEQSCTGFIGGWVHQKKLFNPCFKMQSSAGFYDGMNLLNGYNRPYLLPNIWSSAKLEPEKSEWLMLKWDQEVSIQEIKMFLNPDLSKEMTSTHGENWSEHHGFIPRLGMPPELVKDYSIYGLIGGKWEQLAEVRNNHKRMTVDRFAPIITDQIKIEFTGTYGSPYIEVFEVRVY